MATGFVTRFKGKIMAVGASLFQMGSGGGDFGACGNMYVQQGPVSGAGAIQPGATAADNVLASYFVPANTLDKAGRTLMIEAFGNFAATANSKTCKVIVGSASATVGSTIGAGGTTVSTTGASTASGVGWALGALVVKYGAQNSNTQTGQETDTIVGTVHGGMGLAAALTLTENSGFWVAITGNAATAVTDITLTSFQIEAFN